MLPKLKDLLNVNLNKITYSDEIKPKHQKRMSMQPELISDDMRIPHRPFPENSSKETQKELQWLVNYNNGNINKKFIEAGDNVTKIFEEYCKENNLEYDKDYYKQVVHESTKTILSLKYYYNRPRPFQLAKFYGIKEFENYALPSMYTPSYPSGHSTQGYLMAELLGRKYPKHYDNFQKLANMISHSRLMARAHYPSDCKFGKEVGKQIAGKVIQKKND